VVSEPPCGTAPTKWRFLARNRLIAALGSGHRRGRGRVAQRFVEHCSPRGNARASARRGSGPVTSATSAGCHRSAPRVRRAVRHLRPRGAGAVGADRRRPAEHVERRPESRSTPRCDEYEVRPVGRRGCTEGLACRRTGTCALARASASGGRCRARRSGVAPGLRRHGEMKLRVSDGEASREDLASERQAESWISRPRTEAFVDHLERVRRLSPATAKAYRSDLRDLDASAGGISLDAVDLEVLRDWLWRATQRGDARSTLARRAAAARSFFSWAHEQRARRTRPEPPADRAEEGTDSAHGRLARRDVRAARRPPRRRRDRATRSRCATTRSSSCSTAQASASPSSADWTSTTSTSTAARRACSARARRSGSSRSAHRRGMPGGVSRRGRPLSWRGARSYASAVILGSRGARIGPRVAVYELVARVLARRWSAPRPSVRTRCGTPRPPTFSTAEPICGPCRRSSGTRASARPRSTRTSRPSA
jgi:integrase/recombinase XerC